MVRDEPKDPVFRTHLCAKCKYRCKPMVKESMVVTVATANTLTPSAIGTGSTKVCQLCIQLNHTPPDPPKAKSKGKGGSQVTVAPLSQQQLNESVVSMNDLLRAHLNRHGHNQQ
jgi:hypothetical protein